MELAAIGRLVAACIVIAFVLGGVQLVATRLGRASLGVRGGTRLVSLVDTTPLPGAASLHVIRIAERYFVVGRSSSSLQTLAEIPTAEIDRWHTSRGTAGASAVAPICRFARRLRGRP